VIILNLVLSEHMPKDLKIDFVNLTLDSIADDNLNHDEVENIEIDLSMFNYGVDGEHNYEIHAKDIDLKKFQVFNNLQHLSIIQKKDNEYITNYAKTSLAEDLAETFHYWLALRYKKIGKKNKSKILETIPNRIQFLDAQSFDMYPLAPKE